MVRNAVFSSVFFRLYAGLWRMARPLLKRRARLADGWAERCVPADWMAGEAPVDLWVQAASGGEAHLAVALLKAMPERPGLRVLVSTWTRQGRQVIEGAMPGLRADKPWLSVLVRYAPLDEPAVARRAVKLAAPRALVLLETELWPGLMGACAEAGVPLYVVNGRMTKTSYECYRVIASVLRRLPVRAVYAVSPGDADRFARVFDAGFRHGEASAGHPVTVELMPNIKLDRAVETLGAPPCLNLAPLFRKVSHLVLLASVRKEEERLLGPWAGRLLRAWPDGAVVVAPRHMHRVKAWMSRLYDLGLRPMAATELGGGAVLPGSVLVWDRFGELPGLYAVANSAFVGGSFGLGGQNFLEALAAGLVPCVGPSLDNFRWALGLEPLPDGPALPSLEEAGLLRICSSPRAACEWLLKTDSAPAREDVRARFLAWLRPRSGGAAYAARLLDAALTGAEGMPGGAGSQLSR
ncbi:MAG: 3-deoxy-D-manno-octulosonic acid transferase [Desulfovibrionaceae bacterium]|nr:3-deoxy-D-manno-octulosonic acid transferase [Desulfovibrionaceae bacterium]